MANNTYEESKKGVKKIKKFLITLMIIIISISTVNAEENLEVYPDVTDDIEIRYKWYKEIVSTEGEYYPLKDVNPEDKIDKNNIKYIGKDIYNPQHCSLPDEYYLKTQRYIREYKKVYNASYILIENIDSSDNVQIYYDNQLIGFKVMSVEDNKIKINLMREYLCDRLLFFVDTEQKYKISIYRDLMFEKLVLSKEIENEKISIPNQTWITEETEFYTYITPEKLKENSLVKLMSEKLSCSYKEKYVYKYNVTKEYYDDNYHLNVDGYIKDESDYRFFYKGNPITNTIEVIKEKIVKEPQIEYVYIEKENNTQENDSSKDKECFNEPIIETKTEVKTQIVEKEVFKIPQKIYIVILILIIVIISLIIKTFKKNVD